MKIYVAFVKLENGAGKLNFPRAKVLTPPLLLNKDSLSTLTTIFGRIRQKTIVIHRTVYSLRLRHFTIVSECRLQLSYDYGYRKL